MIWTQRGDDMSWREIDDEVIVLDLRAATYLRLNPSGAVLWRQLEPGASEPDLVKVLADRFELAIDQATVEVVAFIDSCLEKEIIKAKRP